MVPLIVPQNAYKRQNPQRVDLLRSLHGLIDKDPVAQVQVREHTWMLMQARARCS